MDMGEALAGHGAAFVSSPIHFPWMAMHNLLGERRERDTIRVIERDREREKEN